MNEVDKLALRIEKLQATCDHNFQITKAPKLQESLVKGVFVGCIQGYTEVGFSETGFTLKCTKCSETVITNITQQCPHCLKPMKTTSPCLGANSRKQYFGKDYVYYAIMLRHCESCSFAVASDEWDQ